MRKRGSSPHLVAAMASSFVLVVGTAVAAWFVEVRGIGVRAELQSARALELEVLAGAIVVLAVVTQFCVANAVRKASPAAGGERRLLRRALEVDYADPDALAEFDRVPELRDLVGMLMAEKTQVREQGDRLEILRGEIDSLEAGMRRSTEDLSRMREESQSGLGLQVTRMWNGLIERVRTAEAAAEVADHGTVEVVAPAVAPSAAAAVAATGDIGRLVDRLDELEAELDLLRSAMARPGARGGAGFHEETVAPASHEFTAAPQRPLLGGAAPPAADPWRVRESATTPVGEDADWGTVTPVEPVRPATTWQKPELPPVRELFINEEEDAAASADALPAFGAKPFAAGTGIHADLAPGFTGEPFGTTSADGLPRFEDINFPHFVGKPVQTGPERVEVTYESQPNEEVVDLPSSALLFESEAEAEPEAETSEPEAGVLDLRSLGALEFDR